MFGSLGDSWVVILGLLWDPVMSDFAEPYCYEYLQSVPVVNRPRYFAAVFLLGSSLKKFHAGSRLSAWVAGFVLGMFRLVLLPI